jgi:DNA replication protein DnaC
MAYRLALSGCDAHKSLAQFDFAAVPGVNRSLIQELSSCAFVARHENLLLCGPTGVGKSHLANAIACEALKRGYRAMARPTHRLLADLQAARATGGHQRLLSRVLGVDLLLLDDFGLQPLGAQAVQDLYDIISERYERGSIILTSNRALEEWSEPFANDLLASAALDRLTHHAHTLIIRGQSYRQRQRRKEDTGSPAQPA